MARGTSRKIMRRIVGLRPYLKEFVKDHTYGENVVRIFVIVDDQFWSQRLANKIEFEKMSWQEVPTDRGFHVTLWFRFFENMVFKSTYVLWVLPYPQTEEEKIVPVRHPSKEEVSKNGAYPEESVAHPRNPILITKQRELKKKKHIDYLELFTKRYIPLHFDHWIYRRWTYVSNKRSSVMLCAVPPAISTGFRFLTSRRQDCLCHSFNLKNTREP